MANIQLIADRIFQYVEQNHLHSEYAVAMGALIEFYAHDDEVHAWMLSVPANAVDKLLACMVLHRAWHDESWIKDYIRDSGARYADVPLIA